MKKLLFYILIFLLLFFIIPAFLTKTTREVSNKEIKIEDKQPEVKEENKTPDKTSNIKIKLLHKSTNEIEEIDLEDYICNVVSAEMPADYEKEALKAQAIVARTYTMYKINHKKHENADICDDSSCCQAWISKEERLAKWDENTKDENWNKIKECVDETRGKIITYNNEPINAFFHANSGGTTETAQEVWGGEDFPYLKTVQTAGEEGYKQYSSEVVLSPDELTNKIKEKYTDIKIDLNNKDEIKIIEYTNSGRVKNIKIGNHELSGVETRTLLGLKSANFEVNIKDGKAAFQVKGYGHGVGMSQTGANSLAKEGKSAEEIIKHFYTDVDINDV